MKQKDVAVIILVAVVAAMGSFFLSRFLFESGDKREQKAEIVDVISTDFQQPDKNYFNDQSVNPTQLIRIGNSNNKHPFNQKAQ